MNDELRVNRAKLVYLLSLGLLAAPILYAIDWKLANWKFWTYSVSLGTQAVFIFLAFVPGILSVVYHLVTVTQRRLHNQAAVDTYYVWRNDRKAGRPHQKGLKRAEDPTPGPVSANAASLMLTSVFLFIAVAAAYIPRTPGVRGMIFAGLGAFIAVLYFMVARLYASALTSRFLMASALGTASAVAMGWIFGVVGVTGFGFENTSLASICFLSGLFHRWAFDALRRRARKLFGQPEPETVELPITMVAGIDDIHSDLLSEYGVSTVQHLATAEPGELCERTLLPLDRISDWIDQAILITYFNKNIGAARALLVRGATNLVLIYRDAVANPQGNASKLLDSLAEKTSTPRAAIDAAAREMSEDYTIHMLYELREGKSMPEVPSVSAGLELVSPDEATIIGRLRIKQPSAPAAQA